MGQRGAQKSQGREKLQKAERGWSLEAHGGFLTGAYPVSSSLPQMLGGGPRLQGQAGAN